MNGITVALLDECNIHAFRNIAAERNRSKKRFRCVPALLKKSRKQRVKINEPKSYAFLHVAPRNLRFWHLYDHLQKADRDSDTQTCLKGPSNLQFLVHFIDQKYFEILKPKVNQQHHANDLKDS